MSITPTTGAPYTVTVGAPSLSSPAGAASLARCRLATNGQAPRIVDVRSPWWECKHPVRAFLFFACSKGAEGQLAVIFWGLGVIAAIISLFFCVARRRARQSFVAVVTERDYASSQEDLGWKCDDSEGTVFVQAGPAGQIAHIQRHASLLWEFGNQPCGDNYWANCLCDGGCPCWDTVAVYLADPSTGQRKKVKCCGCECDAQPDYRWDCLEHGRDVEAALRAAHAVSGGPKFAAGYENPVRVEVAPPPGYAQR